MHATRAAETHPAYSAGTTRFNLVLPLEIKREIDRLAAERGLSAPDLARRFLEEGVTRLGEEAAYARLAEYGPKHAAHDLQVVKWWDRLEEAWEKTDAAARRRG